LLWFFKFFKGKIRIAFYFIISLILFGVLSMVAILPSAEFLAATADPKGFDLSAATQFSFPIKHLLTYIDPFLLGNPRLGTYPPFWQFDGSIFWENTGYVGWIPLIFAGIAILQLKKNRHPLTIFFLFVLFISLLLMSGGHSPLYFLYSYWPFNLFRVPSRYIWTFTLALVVLCTVGFEQVTKIVHGRVVNIIILGLLGFNTLMLHQTWQSYHVLMPASDWLSSPPILNETGPMQRVMTLGASTLHNKTFLESGWQEMSPYVFLKNSLFPNSNLLWHVPQLDASLGRYLRRSAFIDRLLSSQISYSETANLTQTGKNILNLTGTDIVISTLPFSASGQFSLLSTQTASSSAIYAYRNNEARSRAYLVYKTVTAETLAQAQIALTDENFYNEKQALVEEPLLLAPSATAGLVKIATDADTLVAINIENNPATGLLVLADTYYPGWEATVDGVPSKIYAVNIRQRGVLVPAGSHAVEFNFRPQSFRRGVLISSFGHALVLLLIFGSILKSHWFPQVNHVFSIRKR
jgi:uncharacterized membrane protein YfhO